MTLKQLQTPQMVLRIMAAMAAILFALWILFSWSDQRLVSMKDKSYDIVSVNDENSPYLVHVDQIVGGEHLIVEGWCLKKGTEYKSVECRVVFQDITTQEMFIAPTVMTVRSEGTEMANDGLNYDNSGFYLSLPSEFINSDTAMYNVFLLLHVNQEPVLIDLEQVITVTKGGVIG